MNEFYLNELSQLISGQVVNTVTDTEEEFFGLQIKMPEGETKVLWFYRDDEANGPGSFEISDYPE
jgi:hypothetical protein